VINRLPTGKAKTCAVCHSANSKAVGVGIPAALPCDLRRCRLSSQTATCWVNAIANAILPGLMDTPMAVDTRARVSGKSRAEVAAARDARVPLRHKMGTAWDVANAALFLASDEANFITGVALPVDGGALVNIN
jgi:enoyl-[acyl-carrier-protein] reductase (NADH)